MRTSNHCQYFLSLVVAGMKPYKNTKHISQRRSSFRCRRTGDERVGKSASKKKRRPDDQEDERASRVHSASPARIAEKAHWIEPDQETDDGNSGVPDEFGGYVGKHECSPVVSTTFALPVYPSKSAMMTLPHNQ
jgi:hypothetical protein